MLDYGAKQTPEDIRPDGGRVQAAAAGRATGIGFERDAHNAAEAFRATLTYFPSKSSIWLYVIPSYPSIIAVKQTLTVEQERYAIALALGHILSFHVGREDYAYLEGFTPKWGRDEEYFETQAFATAFCHGGRH